MLCRPRSAAGLTLVLTSLGLLWALFLGPVTPSNAEPPASEPTRARPFSEIFLPVLVRNVGQPFPTDVPPPPTATPTATNTRRSTITATVKPSNTATPAAMTPTATLTLPPGVTPSRTPSPTVTLTPTPAGRIVVASSNAFQQVAGTQTYIHVVGEIRNESAARVTQPTVLVRLRDETNATITSFVAEVYARILEPGQTAPFRLVVDRPTEYDHVAVDVTNWAWAQAAALPALTTPINVSQTSGSEAALLGKVVNSTNQPISHLRVVAVFRDAARRVVNVVESGVGQDGPYGLTLNPGSAAPFHIGLQVGPFPASPDFTHVYDVAPAPAPSPLPTARVRAEQTNGRADIFGEVHNTLGYPVREVQVVATFYDTAGRVVGADWVWASQNADRIVNPGERAPFQVMLIGPSASAWRRYEIQTFHRPSLVALPSGVTFTGTTFQVSLDQLTLRLRGRVTNGTEAPFRNPRLVVTFVSEDTVRYMVAAELPSAEGLAPGASTDFALDQPLPRGMGESLRAAAASYALDFRP